MKWRYNPNSSSLFAMLCTTSLSPVPKKLGRKKETCPEESNTCSSFLAQPGDYGESIEVKTVALRNCFF